MEGRQNDNHVELVSEMMARCPDEWIFFEVVEDDEYGRPYKGRLIAHSPDCWRWAVRRNQSALRISGS